MGQDLAWKQGTIILPAGLQIPMVFFEFDTYSPRRAGKYQVLHQMSTKKYCIKKLLLFSMHKLGLQALSRIGVVSPENI